MNSVSLLALIIVIITMDCDRTEASKFNRTSYDNPSAIVFIDSDIEVTQKTPQTEKTSPMTTTKQPFDLDNRFVIVGATCPTGYAKIGGWCVETQSVGPDPDYD